MFIIKQECANPYNNSLKTSAPDLSSQKTNTLMVDT